MTGNYSLVIFWQEPAHNHVWHNIVMCKSKDKDLSFFESVPKISLHECAAMGIAGYMIKSR
jgi:hypothetical protein